MFDIGFFELLIIAIVGLVVIGPERLPETVRSISLWIGRLKRSLRETRSELEKQLGADDIRRQLHNEEVMQSLERTRREVEASMHQAMSEGGKDTSDSSKDLSESAKEKDPDAEERSKPRTYAAEEPLPDHAHGSAAAPVTPPTDQPKP